jgi:hypothetical protein
MVSELHLLSLKKFFEYAHKKSADNTFCIIRLSWYSQTMPPNKRVNAHAENSVSVYEPRTHGDF